MVLDSSGGHAAGKVDQGFALRILAVRLGQCLQSRKPPVGVEDVELDVIRNEGLVGRVRVAKILRRSIPRLGRIDLFQSLGQSSAIVGEVLNELKGRAVGGDGD